VQEVTKRWFTIEERELRKKKLEAETRAAIAMERAFISKHLYYELKIKKLSNS